ncbi:hypothetical protein Focb16_v005236 [Fusarium oxysporum f. sp. cubense]|uniref:Uncharacterized protein n=1 Tax=Fusarium oxysporum f. sp. cubense TaxID=61366 RepID=A0A559LHC9_FUSOC|nr:hypothetical protein Focb16_v005236 [Fusarium oxysporum f. sp. cubense]
MASQSSYEFPPEWGLVPPNPDPDLVLPGDAIEKELDRIEMPSLDVPISRIIGSTPLAFRPDVEIPELSEIDSETDEQPGTPPDAGASFAGWNRTVESDSPPVQRVTVIGGAVVRNLCLVIPDEDMNGFADLPVQPIRASKGQPAQLVAKILDDETEKPPMPFLLLPDERRGDSDIKRGALEEKKDEESEKEKLGRSKMDEFVLSGDIDDFWGIKGLTAKLYKYQGPEKDAVDVPKEPEDKEDKSQDDTEEPSGKMVPLSTEPDTKPSDDKDDKDIKEEDSEEHDKDETAREKIKLNTESFSLKGQPLGTLFPSINDFNLKNLPVENLEFTYSEEKKNFLFKPGLRLEVDVLFTNSLAWAGDALRKLFGPTDPPKSIHLTLKAWDLLNFRTLGIEITATKATKNKPSKEKPEGDKHEDGKPKGETETTKLSKFRATEQSPDDGGGENEEGEDDEEGSDDKAKEKKSWFFGFAFFGTVLVTKVPHANRRRRKKKDDKEGDEDDEDDKAAEDEGEDVAANDKSIKTMDASPKDDDKKSGENDQKGKETDKKEDEPKHKRSWNLLIKPDKWENIYGIENVTMKDAEFKASFEEGDFRSTVKPWERLMRTTILLSKLCATIPSFPQLEELNGKKKLEGLTLVLSITSNGKISATIDLPESFKLQLSDTAYLHSFGTTIAIKSSTGPELNIHATLTLAFKDSDPISVEGVIVGSFKGARGELKMSDDSKWVNPFNLNKNMVFSQLGFGTGFTYATVLVTGPDAEAVFQLEMNKLDAMEIIQLAGVLIDNQAMQQMKGAEDKLVFKDLKLYVSSGAEFLGRYYDRGIQVQGKMWCFGKKGEFDGRFDENGVVIKAGIDNFKVGGLEITSTREGVDRATMDIEMTKDRQKLFIDGRIRYYSLEISVFLDLDIQEQYLKVDIKIKLTESLLLSLKADVVVKNHNSLEGAEMSFEAILETDILGVILQGITNGIDALHKLADKAIDNARSDLTTKLAQKKAALKAMKSELDKLEKKCTAEVLKKRDEIDKENELLRGLHDEFDKYAEAYREAKEAKERNEKEIEKQRNLRDEARRRLGTKKTDEEESRRELGRCIEKLQGGGQKLAMMGSTRKNAAYWVAKLTEATLGLEEAHARKAIDAEFRHAGKAIMDLPAFRSIEVAINEAARKIDQFGRALDGLVNRGLTAWIEEMLKDEREDLNRQIRLLEALLRKSEEFEAAYKQAKKDLDKTEERLSPKQEAARKRIAEIEGEIKMLPAQHEYMNKKKDYENMEIQVNHLIATLDDIKRVMEEVSQIGKDVLNTLKKGIPRVTKIIVRASNRTFADDKPLMFEIQAVWMDKHETFRVEWAPNQGISVLYSQAAEKLATWGHEDEPPALPEPEPEPTPQPDPTPQDPKPEPEPEPQDPDHKAKIHLIHRGANNDADWPYWSTFDGQTWSKDYKVWSFGLHISDGFCLASFQKKLFIFHLNPQNHKSQVFYESYASGAWTRGAATTIPNTVTSPGMCAVTFQGKLYLLHHGIPQEKLRYNVFNGRTWEGDTDIHIEDFTVGFTAVVFNDKIYLF